MTANPSNARTANGFHHELRARLAASYSKSACLPSPLPNIANIADAAIAASSLSSALGVASLQPRPEAARSQPAELSQRLQPAGWRLLLPQPVGSQPAAMASAEGASSRLHAGPQLQADSPLSACGCLLPLRLLLLRVAARLCSHELRNAC